MNYVRNKEHNIIVHSYASRYIIMRCVGQLPKGMHDEKFSMP